MKKHSTIRRSGVCIAMLAILYLTSCRGSTPAPVQLPAQGPELEILDTAITVDGRLVPKEWTQLSFLTAGQVDEVLVRSGEAVKQGDVLARLGNQEAAEAAISAARMELLMAEQAYQSLSDRLKTDQQQALQTLYNARQAVKNAEEQLEYWQGSSVEADADLADAQVIRAEDKLETAQNNFEEYEDEERGNLTRVRYLEELANAQLDLNNAVRHYNSLKDSGREFNLTQVRTALLIARAQLDLAEEQYNKMIKGPDPDTLAAAQARLRNAESQLTAALANFEAFTLRSEMDGEVMDITLKAGEQVAMGVPVAWVADLSQWVVETENLTEIDVVEITEGQEVSIVFDALPDLTFTGEVLSIGQVYQEKRGDITYTAKILIHETEPRFRWGMTCAITFLTP
jgi:multidrug resistance efflux pump